MSDTAEVLIRDAGPDDDDAIRALVAEVLAADAKSGSLSRADAAAHPSQPPGRRTARRRLPAPS